MTSQNNKIVENWLLFTAFMVFAMAVIGAITRLSESGLSMVEWRPLIGALPPLSENEWERVFALYQQTPEYQKKNFGMELSEFKTIFFWEWFHRLWGRLIGVIYALPLLYFWVRGQIPQGYKLKLLIGLILGGLQGIMGWYMVKSGLVDRPSVSHLRLATHLSLAFIIYGYLLWIAFDLRSSGKQDISFCLKRHGWTTLFLVGVTIIWGAFVAGLDAGLVYNSWPKMGVHWIPPELTNLTNLIQDPVSVQFFHRWIAIVAMIAVVAYAWRIKSPALGFVVLIQVGLGISTLITQVWLPLAALHQAGAFIVVGLLIHSLNKYKYR
ncbi:MAG: COX15/CtaA family protein [Alphaproteobacteria bacterium]|nr:COX15/CtaA family protein [Alphaproteobacteria bacterium]